MAFGGSTAGPRRSTRVGRRDLGVRLARPGRCGVTSARRPGLHSESCAEATGRRQRRRDPPRGGHATQPAGLAAGTSRSSRRVSDVGPRRSGRPCVSRTTASEWGRPPLTVGTAGIHVPRAHATCCATGGASWGRFGRCRNVGRARRAIRAASGCFPRRMCTPHENPSGTPRRANAAGATMAGGGPVPCIIRRRCARPVPS